MPLRELQAKVPVTRQFVLQSEIIERKKKNSLLKEEITKLEM